MVSEFVGGGIHDADGREKEGFSEGAVEDVDTGDFVAVDVEVGCDVFHGVFEGMIADFLEALICCSDGWRREVDGEE